ncbi:MAG: hypothetical protein IPO41_03565 [Acidobacteria bacterium]|nr:hypothetical protein [Acidobacteriota bacterium]MBP7475894.1 hypothetical protein [Pyrinomonadaceae bacterium]
MNTLAAVIVVVSAIWLVGLAMVAFAKPDVVKDFFGKFASSAFAHFLEMFVRLMVGAAFVIYASQMKFSAAFTAFGWLLIATTAVLLFVPWKLHRRFADKSLPMVHKWMTVFGVVSLFGGVLILYSFFFGTTS